MPWGCTFTAATGGNVSVILAEGNPTRSRAPTVRQFGPCGPPSPGMRSGRGGTSVSWRAPSEVCAVPERRASFRTGLLFRDSWVRGWMGPCGTEVGTNSFHVGALFPQLQPFPGCLMACFAVKRGTCQVEGGNREAGSPARSEDRVADLRGRRAVGSF